MRIKTDHLCSRTHILTTMLFWDNLLYTGHVMPFHTLSEPALSSYSTGQCCGRQLEQTPGFCHCIHHNDLERELCCCERLIGLCSTLFSTVPERGPSISQNFCGDKKRHHCHQIAFRYFFKLYRIPFKRVCWNCWSLPAYGDSLFIHGSIYQNILWESSVKTRYDETVANDVILFYRHYATK